MNLTKRAIFSVGDMIIVTIWFSALLVLVTEIGDPTPARASSIAASVERSLARKLALRGEAATLTAAERAALSKIWRDLDEKTLAAIERRYGSHIGAERLSQAARTPATIVDRTAFDKHLRENAPGMSEAQRKSVLGYYYDGHVNVNGNQVQVPLTAAHERLHQLAHPRFRETFGRELDEGVTEQFARGIYGDLGLADMPKVYPNEQRVVTMLGARVGEERLASAYFKGDITSLRTYMDSDLGTGAFQRFTQALKGHDLEGAIALLR